MLTAHTSTNAQVKRDFLVAEYELFCIRNEYSGDAGRRTGFLISERASVTPDPTP
jgi:hypothetical protein